MPHNNKGNGGDLTFNIYGYDPSEAAAIVFLVAFAIISILHILLVVKSRVWWYSVVLVGGVAEIIGWGGRLWSAIDVYSLNAFLIQQICLILAPCFFSAVLYGSLGMLIRHLGPQYSRLRPNLYMIIFCSSDLIAIVVQAIGGAMAAIALQNNKASSTGTHIMVVGIVLQLASMIVFCVLGAHFFRSALRGGERISGGVKIFALALAWGSLWILVRCVYRTVELAQGWTGYLITHQPYFLCLDSVPMVFTMSGFLPGHPWFCLPGPSPTGSTPPVSKVEESREQKHV